MLLGLLGVLARGAVGAPVQLIIQVQRDSTGDKSEYGHAPARAKIEALLPSGEKLLLGESGIPLLANAIQRVAVACAAQPTVHLHLAAPGYVETDVEVPRELFAGGTHFWPEPTVDTVTPAQLSMAQAHCLKQQAIDSAHGPSCEIEVWDHLAATRDAALLALLGHLPLTQLGALKPAEALPSSVTKSAEIKQAVNAWTQLAPRYDKALFYDLIPENEAVRDDAILMLLREQKFELLPGDDDRLWTTVVSYLRDLSFNDGRLRYRQGEMQASPMALAALKRWMARRGDAPGPLFCGFDQEGAPLPKVGLAAGEMRRMWQLHLPLTEWDRITMPIHSSPYNPRLAKGLPILMRPWTAPDLERHFAWLFGEVAGVPLKPLMASVLCHTTPPGASIYEGLMPEGRNPPGVWGQLVGVAGEPITLDMSTMVNPSTGEYVALQQYTFYLPGFKPKIVMVQPQQLVNGNNLPFSMSEVLDGPLHLVAYYWLRSHPALVGTVACVLVALAFALVSWLARMRRKLAHAERLNEVTSTSSADGLAGQTMGKYILRNRLGEGGTSTVYRAVPLESLDDKDAVAIKILNTADMGDQERARFRREIRVWRDLRHPSIVHLIDWGEQSGVPYIVMELVSGSSLRKVLQSHGREPMALQEVSKLMQPVFAAVAFAHKSKIVHRDVKPENVMVSTEGRVRLLDFGVARGPQGTTVTRSGEIFGTVAYLPPERLRGIDNDPRSDQYALGVMLYEMLAGTKPFGDQSPDLMLLQQMASSARPLVEVRPDLSAEVSAVVMRMLEKNMEARFKTVDEAWNELQRAALRPQPQ